MVEGGHTPLLSRTRLCTSVYCIRASDSDVSVRSVCQSGQRAQPQAQRCNLDNDTQLRNLRLVYLANANRNPRPAVAVHVTAVSIWNTHLRYKYQSVESLYMCACRKTSTL